MSLAPGALDGLRIAQLLESDGPGGAEQVVVHLSRRLAEAGAELTVYVPARGQGWIRTQLEGQGIGFETFDIATPFSPGFARWLVDSFRRRRIQVAHSHEFSFAVYGAWAAPSAGVAHLNTMHGGRYYVEKIRRRIALGIALRRTDEAVAVSERLRRHLSHDLLWPASRIHLVPNGIPERGANPHGVRDALGIPAGVPLLLAVGNLYPVKGHRVLLEAMAALPPTRGHAPWLAVAGRGDELGPLTVLADRLGLAERVRFLGIRSDVPDLLAAADLFVMPSLSEGLPIAILEAMFAGKPIVASAVGDIGAAVGEGGLLVPPGEPAPLAQAMARLLDNPDLGRAMGARGLIRARAEYTVDRMTGRYVELYRLALSRRRA